MNKQETEFTNRQQAKITRLQAVIDDTETALQVIRAKLGIRDDFVPLGIALELAPILKSAMARIEESREVA